MAQVYTPSAHATDPFSAYTPSAQAATVPFSAHTQADPFFAYTQAAAPFSAHTPNAQAPTPFSAYTPGAQAPTLFTPNVQANPFSAHTPTAQATSFSVHASTTQQVPTAPSTQISTAPLLSAEGTPGTRAAAPFSAHTPGTQAAAPFSANATPFSARTPSAQAPSAQLRVPGSDVPQAGPSHAQTSKRPNQHSAAFEGDLTPQSSPTPRRSARKRTKGLETAETSGQKPIEEDNKKGKGAYKKTKRKNH